MIKWLFFDLGSTLIDESACDEFRLQELLNQKNAPGRGEVLSAIRHFASLNLNAYRETAEMFGLNTTPWPVHLEKLYPDAKPVLSELKKRYHLGIIANQNPGTFDRLEGFGIGSLFDVVVSSGDFGKAKPDPKIFLWALKAAHCKPAEAAMIGDRLDNDIVPAQRLGMATVWIKQGMGKYGDADLLPQKPDHTVSTLPELLDIL